MLTRSSEFGGVSFDKDDELAMEFVVAATNLRVSKRTPL